MAITLTTAARNAAVDAVVDLIDVGGTGDIQICTTGFALALATLNMSSTAFAAAASGQASAQAITNDTSTIAGTAAVFRIRNGTDVNVITGTVGTGSGDINFNSLAFTNGGTCSISGLTYTQPAS